MRFLLSAVVLLAGAGLLLLGVAVPLTPSKGLPEPSDIVVYGGLPIFLMVTAVGLNNNGFVRLVFSVVLIAGIALLGYTGLALFADSDLMAIAKR